MSLSHSAAGHNSTGANCFWFQNNNKNKSCYTHSLEAGLDDTAVTARTRA